MRHGFAGLYAPARGNRAHAVGEIRACAGDPRALPAHRQSIRSLRQRAVPHPGGKPRLGRSKIALAHSHQPRRCFHRAIHRHGHGPAARPKTSRHCRHRAVQGALVPYQPLGLRLHRRRLARRADGKTGGQARRHHRHRRDVRAVRAASRARLQGTVRLPAHAVFHRCPRQRADRSKMVCRDRDARLATALAREFYREPGRRQREGRSGPGRLDRSGAPDPRKDRSASARAKDAAKHAGGL